MNEMNGETKEVRTVRQILGELRDRIKFGDSRVDTWREISEELEVSSRIEVVGAMINNDFWYWLSLISDILKEAGERDYLLELLEELGERIDPGLASQIYWDSLVNIGAERVENSKECVEILISKGDRMHSIFASMLMAGIYRSDPEWAIRKISSMIGSDHLHELYSAVSGARIILKEDRSALDGLGNLILRSEIPDDPDVQSIYSMCLRLVYPVDPDEVEKKFLELHEKAPEWIRMQIAYDVSVIPEFSQGALKNILQ